MKLRFTIRDLFWLIVAVALAVAWWTWENKWINDRHAAMFTNRESYAQVTTNVFVNWWEQGSAPWYLRLLGERSGFKKIQLGASKDTPQDEQKEAISKMRSLFPEAEVYIIDPPW